MSSTKALLFALQSPAGSPPLKMPIAAGKTGQRSHQPAQPLQSPFVHRPRRELDGWITVLYSGRGGSVHCGVRGVGAAEGAVKRQLCSDEVELFAVVYEASVLREGRSGAIDLRKVCETFSVMLK